MTAAQRSSPSITEAAFPYGDLEFGPGPERRLLITMDEAYFNKALPRSAVQYMKVFWRRVPSSPSKEAAFDELLANLDFEALRALFDR